MSVTALSSFFEKMLSRSWITKRLRVRFPARASRRQVLVFRSRRNPDPQLQFQLVGDACLSPGGILSGRPTALDLQRQNRRNPLRCHRMSVSGFTFTSASRHWNIQLRVAIIHRVESSARRGLTFRS
jgi:hypothetical protein